MRRKSLRRENVHSMIFLTRQGPHLQGKAWVAWAKGRTMDLRRLSQEGQRRIK